ncbi:unnamed protein product [marine sediment metagenome]|uniref:Uncharacterized protein n=1 Tax=marine sediment metagenome TaxID=412755 RepID=X0VMS0_9ZZZZ
MFQTKADSSSYEFGKCWDSSFINFKNFNLEGYFIMQTINSDITTEQQKGRWVVVDGGVGSFNIDETARVIKLQTATSTIEFKRRKPVKVVTQSIDTLSKSLQQLMAWTDTPPKQHGKFYLDSNLTKKQRALCEQMLDGRFVLCSS